jgi:hypothetical protein
VNGVDGRLGAHRRWRLLRSPTLQGVLFAISTWGFIAAVWAEARWVQNMGAVVGIGFGLAGFAGLFSRWRAERRGGARGR